MVSPAEIEIFRHKLASIVEEMGLTLQRTAYSTNIKIRKDHTCAIFDEKLRHIAQHDIAPQHIGSLVSVVPDAMEDRLDNLEPGDGFLINDPYMGAVHLPDVMLVAPIFDNESIVGYAANCAHHVDIGGSTPGGIPVDSTELYAEGLIMSGVKGITEWEYDEEVLDLIARNVRGNKTRIGDFQAQLGANKIGAVRFRELQMGYSDNEFNNRLNALLDYTERRVRSAISDLPDGEYRARDEMDGDGIVEEPIPVELAVTVENDELVIDFTGTSEQTAGPLNCTPAIAFAGTMSVIMSLLGTNLPKNDGFYRPIELIVPEGTLVNPTPEAPVAGGWEVGMRAADLVTKALSTAVPAETIAATKGIICNLGYGGTDPRSGEDYVYYETVGGGYGARQEKDGMEAVQAHFQNTANSPIEELETELPIYVRRYELIQDSAGAGRQRGGLGVRRDLEFYDHEGTFTVLSDRKRSPPWGLFGGKEAKPAKYILNPESSSPVDLPSKSTTKLDPDTVVSVQTPGGGGYGDPLERDPEAVLQDVLMEKVSEEEAATEYGVIVDTERRSVNQEATHKHRELCRDL